jgi:MFS family permease
MADEKQSTGSIAEKTSQERASTPSSARSTALDPEKTETTKSTKRPGTSEKIATTHGVADIVAVADRGIAAEGSATAGTTAAAGTATTTAAGEAEVEENDDNRVYPSGFALTMITVGLCLSTLVIALDNTIIATALPTITTDFNALDDVGWIGSSYLLTTTALQPSFGKVYTYFSLKYTYLAAVVIFELGSLICAVSQNATTLIVGRAVAGIGAAGLFSGGMIIVAFAVPLRRRAIFVASLSSMFGIASVVGPILGGALTDKASWRWCFWINLPVGGITILTILIFFANPRRPEQELPFVQKLRELDFLGAGVIISAIVCLLLVLQWGGSVKPWNSPTVIALLVLFGVLVIAFALIQLRRGDRATLPPKLLGQRTILFGSLFSTFFGMALYTHIYFLPFYFQAVIGSSAESSGIRTIPYLVSNTILALVVGGTITAIGFYTPFMIFAGAIFCIGCGLLFTLTTSTSNGRLIGYQILAGGGAGAGVQIPFIAVQVVATAKELPAANAIVVFFLNLGGALSISIAESVFTNTLRSKITLLAPGVDANSVIAAGATHVRDVVSSVDLPAVLVAYTDAIDRAFILPIAVSALATICACFVEFKSVKGKKLSAAPGA